MAGVEINGENIIFTDVPVNFQRSENGTLIRVAINSIDGQKFLEQYAGDRGISMQDALNNLSKEITEL